MAAWGSDDWTYSFLIQKKKKRWWFGVFEIRKLQEFSVALAGYVSEDVCYGQDGNTQDMSLSGI
jgi:hypothetical protein